MYYVFEDAQRPEGSFLFEGVSGQGFAPVALSSVVFALLVAQFCFVYSRITFCFWDVSE